MTASAFDPHLRSRLAALLARLERGLVERTRHVRLALLAALAGEHTLLIGPPGTAKSELARRIHLAFDDARYFERLLTRFSVPEELFGPLSIRALEEDRYERQTAGYLPDASVAFIDEVFKANSAILNALLTLLNERVFDNGTGRQPCPLISIVGATNDVPEGEVAEAFFDRFLVRVPVAPVSAAAFPELMALSSPSDVPAGTGLTRAHRDSIVQAAREIEMPSAVVDVLGELRAHLGGSGAYVSDRRWRKIAWLLAITAASEGRTAVCEWDLWLLPWCTAHDADGQQRVRNWLLERLGLGGACAPRQLTRVVEAFETQAALDAQAEELDYDASGRLRFRTELDERVQDAKGAAQVARMRPTRRRRYGETHIAARVRQVGELIERIAGYEDELAMREAELAAYRAQSLWLDGDFVALLRVNLHDMRRALEGLAERAIAARLAFEALPRLATDSGIEPDPIGYELSGR